ncbi:hypothetical protein [Leptospira sp. 'Mane']|uniref:hypothetical protein n=1 Tax=Leptospira sp. 'Mane' TaxID=3387407 RepID=UPI00398A5AB7
MFLLLKAREMFLAVTEAGSRSLRIVTRMLREQERVTSDVDDCVKKEKELTEAQTADYNKNFGTEIEKLKAAGYEIQGGKIVKSLSQEEKIRLGQVADTRCPS